MLFQVEQTQRTVGGTRQDVYLLSSSDRKTEAEIWPGLGCNCLRWQVDGPFGPLDLLYVARDWETIPVPTRSGVPVLFPFPNRIANGRFEWNGREFRPPANDALGRNAIHGFACRRPWRVLKTKAADNLATLTAEFHASQDSPRDAAYWPGDYKLTLRFLLGPDSLSLSCTMQNPGSESVPLGLGFHPYFRMPLLPHQPASETKLAVPADSFWELRENLPTGRKLPVDPFRDFRTARCFDDLLLDDVFTDLKSTPGKSGLIARGRIEQTGLGAVEVWTSPAFRELVVFTPPSKQAICLEPYTCVTDAVNLQNQGVDTGLIILKPGESRTEFVVFRFARAVQ
jgi:aldose 1-epimerase